MLPAPLPKDVPMPKALHVAVQMDPMTTVNINADSTFALMLEAERRGHKLWHYEVRHMALRGQRLTARAHPVSVRREAGNF
jgi:glutathione synthase